MQRVLQRLKELVSEYDQRQFFVRLDGAGNPAEARALVRALTFFVFAFQDILRLNEQQMLTLDLKKIARQHRAEDLGHQDWFLHDTRMLEVEPDIEWVFGDDHRVTRDCAYRLVSEVFRASDDRVRAVIPLVLEATGHCFFRRVFGFFQRSGVDAPLKYFALSHWHVEEGHEMFQDEHASLLSSLVLPTELCAECTALAERMFAAMATFVDELDARMLERGALGQGFLSAQRREQTAMASAEDSS